MSKLSTITFKCIPKILRMKTKVSIFKIGNLDYSKRVKTGGKRIHKNPTIFNSNTTNRSHLLESTDESSIHLEIFPTLFPPSSPSRLNCTTRASRRRRTRLEFRESRRFEGRSGFRVKPNKAGRNNRPWGSKNRSVAIKSRWHCRRHSVAEEGGDDRLAGGIRSSLARRSND